MNMKIDKIVSTLYPGIILGFSVGLTIYLYYILSNQYIRYKMFRIILFCIPEHINKWLIIFITLNILLLLVELLAKRFCKKRYMSIRIAWSVIICSVLFFYGGWAINHYWLPYRFHTISLLCDVAILLSTIILGWMLIKLKWEKLSKIIKTKYIGAFIRRTALALVIFLLSLNLSILIISNMNIPKGPNIILISIDCLRADHLGSYGYIRNTSPNIDKLSKESVIFTQAFSQSSYTPPSHASMLTSLYVTTHGLYGWSWKLSNKIITIAELLRNENYKTGAFINLHFLRANSLGQGFCKKREGLGAATNINKKAMNWLKSIPKNRKFLLFLHYYDVHRPYEPRTPFKTIFDSNYKGNIKGSTEDLSKIWSNNIELNEKDIYHLDALYDSGINQIDSDLDMLFCFLKNRGIYDNTLIIITSDHGEMTGYHPNNYFKYTHDPVLYNGVINVPLIMKFPYSKYRGKRFDCLVESIDIVPTIIGFLDIHKNPNVVFNGKDLNPIIDSEAYNSFRDFIFSEVYGWEKKMCIIKDQNKFIYNLKTREIELYDLQNDTLELINLAQKNNKLAKELRKSLDEFFASISTLKYKRKQKKPSAKLIQELKSLGYIK